ncbi:MAG: MFS transporter, partial [Desulfobacterales bacterium]
PFYLPILALPIAWIVLSKLDPPEPDKSHAFGDYFRLLGSGIKNFKICGLFIISINTFVILFGSFLTYLPFILSQKFQLGPEKIGLMVCTMSFSQSIMATQLGRLLTRFSKKQILKTAFLLYMTAMVLFPHMPYVGLMLLPTVLFGMAQGVNVPTVQSMLADYAPLERRAAFMSINRWVSQIGQTLGPLFTGLVYARFGLNSVFYAGALMALITFLIIFLFGAKGKDQTPA